MHQHPRTSPRAAPGPMPPHPTSAPSGRPREASAGTDESAESAQAAASAQQMAGQVREGKTKLNQIIQNYFVKAALIVAQSRMICPPSYNKGSSTRRVNKWFNVEIDETDVFREDWRPWKTCDAEENRPPAMIMETFLDTADLTNDQSLVVIDEQGKRWNVDEALNAGTRTSRSKRTQVILERWTIHLGEPPIDQPADLNAILPVVYKKSIVLFRSLYTYSKFLPAWKFSKRLAKLRSNHGAFRVKCRIFSEETLDPLARYDALKVPLFGSSNRVTQDYTFGKTESPAGPFSIEVCYRSSCDFRVDDSEALLSSQFMGIDDHYFRPSLDTPDSRPADTTKEVGSLPAERREVVEPPDRAQAYGSLSTFHQAGPPTGSSPLSALRNARQLGSDSASPSPPNRPAPILRSGPGSKSSLRSGDGSAVPRRPSVSFQPFKSPSLSASPSQPAQGSASPRSSLGRAAGQGYLAQARNRNSMEPPSPSVRQIPTLPEHETASSTSPSPRPAPITRYASSFGHRRGRLSSGGTSKTDEDGHSSGKDSPASSSAQPGSGMLTEGVASGSSGSIKTEEDNISDFLKMLDLKKNLKSFEPGHETGGREASIKRTRAALSKFQRMRETNAALSESMSSSSLLHHRSSSSSSRQLSTVPAMITGTSMSTSSSPGKPISPHTPHTPAVPSRLSANSVVEYAQPRRSRLDHRASRDEAGEEDEETETADGGGGGEGASASNAIDIPMSPRPFHASNRRSSSVTQQQRAIAVEDETGDLLPAFGHRSASMGTDDRRAPLSLSALIQLQEMSDPTLTQPGVHEAAVARPTQPSSSMESPSDQASMEMGRPRRGPLLYRSHLARSSTAAGLHQGSNEASVSESRGDASGSASASVSVSGSGASDRPVGMGLRRYSFARSTGGGGGGGVQGGQGVTGTAGNEEDEPLLFAMSEIGTQQLHGRRSGEYGKEEGGERKERGRGR